MSEDVVSKTATYSLTHRSFVDHVCGYFNSPSEFAIVFFATLTGTWGLIELLTFFLGIDNDERKLLELSWLALFSLAVSLAVRLFRYPKDFPHDTDHLPEKARSLAHLRPKRWEFKFAQTLLHSRVVPIDRRYSEYISGEAYSCATRMASGSEYVDHIQVRLANVDRLLKVAASLICSRFPETLAEDLPPIEKANNIAHAIDAIERFYSDSVEFEHTANVLIPPEGFEKLHGLQKNWTQPLRDGIADLLRWLQAMADAEDDTFIEFKISLAEPPNMDQFCKEFERMTR